MSNTKAMLSGLALLLAQTPSPTPSPAVDCPRPVRVVTAAIPNPSDFGPAYGDGVVTVEVTVGPDGKVTAERIAQSSGNLAMDQAALSAAREATYEPRLERAPVRRQAGAQTGSDANGYTCRAATGTYLFKVSLHVR